MQISFRTAGLTDAEQACPLVYSAAPEAFDYMFGNKAHAFLRFAFENGSGLFGYRNHVVAVVQGRVVGIGAFYSGREYPLLGLANTKQVFRFYGLTNGGKVFKRCLQVQKFIPPPNRHTEYVADLGVNEEWRGKGIGTALLKYQMEIACSKKRRVYALDVSVQNPMAQKLYERLGFRMVNERPFFISKKQGPIPNARRMEID